MTVKLNYRLTPDAQDDLIEIRRYTLEQWGEIQSIKYLSELRQTIRLLSEAPAIGKQCPDIGSDIYSFPSVSHIIYYTLSEQHLIVIGVLHKSMAPLSHLEDLERV